MKCPNILTAIKECMKKIIYKSTPGHFVIQKPEVSQIQLILLLSRSKYDSYISLIIRTINVKRPEMRH